LEARLALPQVPAQSWFDTKKVNLWPTRVSRRVLEVRHDSH